jgi:hypothetical protein
MASVSNVLMMLLLRLLKTNRAARERPGLGQRAVKATKEYSTGRRKKGKGIDHEEDENQRTKKSSFVNLDLSFIYS